MRIFAKKNKENFNQEESLSVAKKNKFNVNKTIELCGGIDNLVKVSATQNKIKIFIKSFEKINIEELLKVKGVSGAIRTSQYITIVIGNVAQLVMEEINTLIN